MQINQEMQQQGKWLFRWRSYLPLFFAVLMIPAFSAYKYMFNCHHCDVFLEVCCMLVGLTGLTIRCLTVGYTPQNTSGRNTREQIADVLNTKGMYSLVRNPLYLGNFLMWAAPILFFHNCWLFLVFALTFMIYYERIIITEEAFLSKKFGDTYSDWAASVPVFFPNIFRITKNWRKPELTFSWKNVLRREYHGFYGLIAVMFAMEIIGDWIVEHRFTLDTGWTCLFISATVFYLVIRFFAKRTTVLTVAGR